MENPVADIEAVQRKHGTAGENAREKSEFLFTEKDFRFIARLIGEHAGIVLGEVKRDLVYGRLVKRLRALGMRRFSDYCRYLEDDRNGEFEEFVNALTTNLTSFYRESHHFEYLESEVLPGLCREPGRRSLRIWSAGCSTGPEPYSIAMSVAECVPPDWDVKILATDIDTRVLADAAEGIFDMDLAQRGLSDERLKRWTLRGRGARSAQIKMRPELQSMIAFRKLNLLEPWPLQKPFDIVFCRNVVIYFDRGTQKLLFDRFANQLTPDGHLIIGHSESLHKVCDRFSLVGKTIYQRIK